MWKFWSCFVLLSLVSLVNTQLTSKWNINVNHHPTNVIPLPTNIINAKLEVFFFFWAIWEIIRMTTPAHGMLNVSGRQCQTSTNKNPTRFFN